MEKQNVNNFSDEIDLIQLVKVLVKKKWLIIGGTLAVTLAALVISLLLPRTFQSSAFFRLSSGVDVNLEELKNIQDKIKDNLHNDLLYNLTLEKTALLDDTLEEIEMMMRNVSFPDYKKYLSRFTNPQRFIRFLEEKKQAGDTAADGLKKGIGSSGSIEQCIEPVYAYSKKDLKELTQNPRDIRNFVIGVQLTGQKESPEKARAFVNALAEFIKDSIIYGKLGDYVAAQGNKCREEYNKFANLIIKDEFKLRQLTAKQSDIEQLLKKYPEAKNMTGRELLSLDKTGYRYLSPAAQLVGIESYIADIKENLAQNRRDKQMMGLKFDFFSNARASLTGEMSGYTFLAGIMKLKDSFFAEKKLPDDSIQQVKNELSIDFDKFMSLREEMQFLSTPTLSRTPVKPQKGLITAVGFVLGLALSVFLAFVVDWWAVNKQKITHEENA
ncbi:MAG: Wzz/FepE/Etk N-terminal domain-containing protein [Candidatus Aminicenantes bacterium]|nr:Wzz/FepE/Etk N-terminal domain-containing protein [Candidatus Aminicenantes bacterium]